jgi:cell division protein FtsI (penicillin-binding protein 3)
MVERRLSWLARIVLLWGAAIFLKLVSLQVAHHKEYSAKARQRQMLVLEIQAPRGTINDRNGQTLAMSVPTESVYINPLKVPDLDFASNILARVLALDRAELYRDMKSAFDNHRGFMWVKRKIDYDEGRRLRDMRLDWVDFQKESQRHYPKGELAAHTLGSVDFEEAGNAGIEKFLDKQLRGQPGVMRLLTDVKRRGIYSEVVTEAHPGVSLTLTIDERLQFEVERDLAEAVKLHDAVSGSVVVMAPATGDILAIASYPTYDPNLPPQPGRQAARLNHAVSVPFEPGSVFKMITLSAALETTTLRPDTPINCHGGVLALPGRIVHDSHAGLGIIPMFEVLARSSNIGAIEIGARVGRENMYDYCRKFGFGQKTGIPLPAESAGKLKVVPRWGKTTLASISMGQEVSVTTLQLAQAAAAIARGGTLVKPRLVLKYGDQPAPPQPVTRVLSAETAATMRSMMHGVVDLPFGTGKRARLVGYTVAGKTGSAQIFDFASHHYTHTYNGSFVGFAPINNPAIVMVVTLNGTHGSAGFGGAASAPVFQKIATEGLRVMEVPKDIVDETPVLVAQTDSLADLASADENSPEPNILEEEEGDETEPAAAAKPGEPGAAGPKVPNFRGMSMRAVLAEAANMGLTVVPDGSGVAREQTPRPGAMLRQGERIRVQFTR